jgi:very-short-patch-repair endonuclease
MKKRPDHPAARMSYSITRLFMKKYKGDNGSVLLSKMGDMLWKSLPQEVVDSQLKYKWDNPWSPPTEISCLARRILYIAESPIEALFLCAVSCITNTSVVHIDRRFPWQLDSFATGIVKVWPSIVFSTQLRLGKYRADLGFAALEDSGVKRVIVECDGHEFHERTKEQVAAAKARDRFMTSSGFYVMRFSGSEIFANPLGCAHEVISFFPDTVRKDNAIRAIRAMGEFEQPRMIMQNGRKLFGAPGFQTCAICGDLVGKSKGETHLHIYHGTQGPLCFVCAFKKKAGVDFAHRKMIVKYRSSWRRSVGIDAVHEAA